MSRLLITVTFALLGSVGGCDTSNTSNEPGWDAHSVPGRGHSWEGSIDFSAQGRLPRELTWDETNVSLITWPEGAPVAATMTVTTTHGAGTVTRIVIEPTAPLERDRWYAVKWDAPPDFAVAAGQLSLLQAMLPSGDAFAWPFWSTSEPILTGATWGAAGTPAIDGIAAGFSDFVESGPDYLGRLLQGTLSCEFGPSMPYHQYLFAPCPDLDLDAPFTLTFDGLHSAGTGEPMSQVTAEVMLTNFGPDNWTAQVNWPVREPPSYAGP